MKTGWRLLDRATGAVVVQDLAIADGFWSRFQGLQFRAGLPPGGGLLLVPCASVHTCWMRFTLDVAMLDARGVVLAIRRAVRPWRVVVAARGTHAVLETPAGGVSLAPGSRLLIRRGNGPCEWPPASVRFLWEGQGPARPDGLPP
jgi:uncharacterized membrane protein (UPF0127 family)